MIILISSLFLALSVSFICSLMEATILSLSPGQIADISLRKAGIGRVLQNMKSNIERPIGVILIVNTAAHTIGATVAGAKFDSLFGDKWIWLFSLIFTITMIQFTEILPKTLGVHFNSLLAMRMARPLNSAIRMLTPVLKIVHWINRPFQVRPKKAIKASQSTIEEITALAGLARISRHISARQEKIITVASRLSNLNVCQVMIPIEQVSFLSTAQTIPEAVVSAHIDMHTRFPVYENDDKEHISGYVNFKEMIYFMRTNPNDSSLRGVIRPVQFVKTDTPVSALLELFVAQHGHMAIVQTEHGKPLGMLTMEDIIEELVGDIQDEFDRLPRSIQALSGDTWIVSGGTPMVQVAAQTGMGIQPAQDTISQWLASRLGKAPAAGDTYREAGFTFTIRRTRRGMIFDVSMVKDA